MKHNPQSTWQAALSFEEFFEQPKPPQSWLLTYLDVFVLIIMLVITLLTLSDFQEKEQSTLKQTKQNKISKPIIQQKTPKAVIAKKVTLPTKTKPLSKKSTETKPPLAIKQATKSIKQEQPTSKKIFKNTKPEAVSTTIESDKILISQKIKDSLNSQQSNEALQHQLEKTVAELGLVDSVKMKVTLGYAQLEIQDQVLFRSSEAKLLNAGEELLKKLAPLLDQSLGLIYIEGHTDNRPIKTEQYPSNWELGAARATSVLHYLVSQRLDSSRLRAVTYADTKPLADNNTKEGRGKNRRVSIVIKVSDKID